ncbi:MAG: 50S ribosomal protein L9 [Bacilli bacterium]|nr:50S ribosomal protein L9 [Bacilli bacterium]
MKVILLQDVKKLGKKDQVIEVSDGYASNYLIPHRLAVQVTKKSNEVLAAQKEEERRQFEASKAEAQKLAKDLEGITLEFKLRTGKDGKCFGNVSLKQIEEAFAAKNIQIDKRKFIDKGPCDALGYYHLRIELFKGVEGVVNIHIDAEGK